MKTNACNRVYSWILVFTFLIVAIPLPSSASLLDGLVTYYAFDGNANDLSGTGNNGTVIDAVLTTDRFSMLRLNGDLPP